MENATINGALNFVKINDQKSEAQSAETLGFSFIYEEKITCQLD